MRVSGTKEWAKYTANCYVGCMNNCRYCYAKFNALNKFKSIEDEDEWKNERPTNSIHKEWKKVDGTIMFPTTHDITPNNVDDCILVLKNILRKGNNVLIVSKPRQDCMNKVFSELEKYKENILFRFTITAFDDEIIKFWEPNSPLFAERVSQLKKAFELGFNTSVSCEPLLDYDNILYIINLIEDYVTDSIWIGKLNQIRQRVINNSSNIELEIQKIEENQTDEKIIKLYNKLKDNSLIKWKESYKEVIGIPLSDEVGLDS